MRFFLGVVLGVTYLTIGRLAMSSTSVKSGVVDRWSACAFVLRPRMEACLGSGLVVVNFERRVFACRQSTMAGL